LPPGANSAALVHEVLNYAKAPIGKQDNQPAPLHAVAARR
jgi:hypothetical protein